MRSLNEIRGGKAMEKCEREVYLKEPETVTLAGDSKWKPEVSEVVVNSVRIVHYFADREIGLEPYNRIIVEHTGPWEIYTDSNFAKWVSEKIESEASWTEQGQQQEGVAILETDEEPFYWGGYGNYQTLSNKLHKLPNDAAFGSKCNDYFAAAGCYYDLYNNGLCNRGEEWLEIFSKMPEGFCWDRDELTYEEEELVRQGQMRVPEGGRVHGIHRLVRQDWIEKKMDSLILAAAKEAKDLGLL